MTDKRVLRARMRADRDAFFASANGRDIAPPAAFLKRLAPGITVATYFPIGSEADPGLLWAAAAAAGAAIALPVVHDRASPIGFALWDRTRPLAHGPFGLRQPGADAPAAKPDIILTPLVAFDAALNRLGQGAGHYDRAFTAHPGAWRLGIAWSMQQVASLPADPWDIPLNGVVTERGYLESKDV